MSDLGLFPLGIVLVPSERVPLHIFEERYKELVGECLEGECEFGLILSDDEGIREVGTKAAVVQVIHRFPDGRLNVVVEGRERFRIVRMTSGRSFQTAVVEDLADDSELPPEEEVSECLDVYRRLADAAGTEPAEVDPDEGGVSFQVAAVIDFAPGIKQDLLELRSEGERLARLTDLMEQAVDTVRLQRTARERAQGNGHVSSD